MAQKKKGGSRSRGTGAGTVTKRPAAKGTTARRTTVKRASGKRTTVKRTGGTGRKVEDIQRLRRDRAAARNYSGTVVAGIFFVIVFIYLMRTAYVFLTKTTIPTVSVQYGSIDEPQIIKAIIIRDESVYYSEAEGTVSYYVKDMDRVKKGASICDIRDEESLDGLEKDVGDIDKNLMDLQARRSDISEAQKEADKINVQIKDTLDKYIYQFAALNMEKLYELKEEVEQAVQIRNQILLSENKGSLREYAGERLIYQEEMDKYITTMYAGESGILSEALDGQEGALSFENRDKLTKEQTTMKVGIASVKKEVAPGDAVFKIVMSNEWYIGAYISNDLVYDYEEGDIKRIYVENGDGYEPMDTLVEQIEKGDNESYVLYNLTKSMLDYLNKRSITIKTSDSVRTGYKIPNSAIVDRTLLRIPGDYVTEEENAAYVYKRTGELLEKADIIIKDRDEDYVYALQDLSGVKLGDTLSASVEGGETFVISDIVSVKGVYMANSGIAEFRVINMNGDISENSAYTILDPSLNKTIRSYDQIVSEAKNIQDGQVIY